jgi:hypothetical protein
MKQTVRLAASIICYALAAGNHAYSQNLVTNPSFEDPIGSEWTWVKVSGEEPTFNDRFTSSTNHAGDYVYRIAYGDAVGSGYIIQTISNLTADATYTIKGWVFLYFRADRNWAYIEAQGGGAPVQAPAQGSNPMINNTTGIWTNIVLTQTAAADGTLNVLLHLDHYTATVNNKDNGGYFDDLEVTIGGATPVVRSQITSISDAGTGSVTVYYTNTWPGSNYVLSFNTNLNSPNWFTAGNKTATGTTDSQTDNSATGDQRFYRVYYATP